jgi:flagellar basal-body rod protein FlgF
MDSLMITAASGMRARTESLDMLANNLANAATAGYKTDREFYSLYTSQEALDPALAGESPDPSTLPVIERHWTDFAQGNIATTGNPLDVALGARGFFAVDGPNNNVLYTRNGSFRLSAAGALTTSDGYAVRGVDGQPIQATGTGALEISRDGTVRQDGVPIGQIAVVDFAKPEALAKASKNYFSAADTQAGLKTAAEVDIQQGKLEASNVTTPETAVRLVSLLRQFEMLQRAAMLGAEMNRRAVEEVAKVS